jgi:hypothetical protein
MMTLIADPLASSRGTNPKKKKTPDKKLWKDTERYRLNRREDVL